MEKKRAPAVKRVRRPLAPANAITVVRGSDVLELSPQEIDVKKVGLKAFGLSCLPKLWTKPYFVVSGDVFPESDRLLKALECTGLKPTDRVLVRSSGVNESIESRGALVSAECSASGIAACITKLTQQISTISGPHNGAVHWVIQLLASTTAKGHLSNERRLSQALRDWVAEVEVSSGSLAEAHRIAIRTWRDASGWTEQPLRCLYRANYLARLENVARWAYDRQIRVHFEWVWDGSEIFIVQADACDNVRQGVEPEQLVEIPGPSAKAADLSVFRLAGKEDFDNYRKLANAALYQGLGYTIVSFFVLDDPSEIKAILEDGTCSKKLQSDLQELTNRPLVIRTDGKHIPGDKKQMLPRSDELRSPEAAVSWLTEKFRKDINNADLGNCEICLIAHHFIPATSSAWCQAHPDQRRVRIESLWGIPEGLYWYAYDVFDVDTLSSTLADESTAPKGLRIREKLRYKERFIAPDSNGAWVVHYTAAGPDWNRSIHRAEWIREIAWTSRRIAKAAGRPVVVMWFIDIPKAASSHRVMPWYHEPWHSDGPQFKAAPRKKFLSSKEQVIHTEQDWAALQLQLNAGELIARVRVEPREPELVRDPHFAKSLADYAQRYKFVVELSGGILSHAYYMLSSSGCDVECTDLDDYATEEDEAEFNKLVRDKIPETIVARGENAALFKLEGEALIMALRRKLIEEAFEVFDAKTTPQITEELADLREVTRALASRLDISEEAIESARKAKLRSRGGFDQALMLSRTAIAPPLSIKEATEKESLASTPLPARIDRTISQVTELPATIEDIHVDKRRDASGTLERQFTLTLPAVADDFKPPRLAFSLETPSGANHNMFLEIMLERNGADLRNRIRLINGPTQLELDFSSQDIPTKQDRN